MRSAEAPDDVLREQLDLCLFAHVADKGLRLRTRFSRQLLRLNQLVLRKVCQRQLRSGAAQRQRDRSSNAAARAGDYSHSSLQDFVSHLALMGRDP